LCCSAQQRDVLKKHGIRTVLDVATKLNVEGQLAVDLLAANKKLNKLPIQEMIDQAKTAVPPPAVVNHRKQIKNPYLSRYGENWEQMVQKLSAMQKIVSVCDAVQHIINAGNSFYGSNSNWMSYHDSLSLMTASETKDWMQEKGFLHRWILPQEGLNAKINGKGTYDGRPVGCNPSLMPLDESLNKDLDNIVLHHVAAMWSLPTKDPRKFDMSTPKQVVAAYKLIWNNPQYVAEGCAILAEGQGAPSSERIVQDINTTVEYMDQVLLNNGLNSNKNIPGWQGDKLQCSKKSGWGGKRIILSS
jgi:hypothetical protein